MPKKSSKKNKTAGAVAPMPGPSRHKSRRHSFVLDLSISTWSNLLVLFSFVFDHHKEHFVEEHLTKMEQADEQDKAQQKISKPKLRLKLRAYIVDAVTAYHQRDF